jgi:Anthrone oxygenase
VLEALQSIATFCGALFAGAALYINFVEHPARLSLDTAAAVAQWAPSYQRATLMQAPLAVVGFLAALGIWLLGGGAIWLAASVLIGAVVPFTFLGIMPTNHKLLAPNRDRASPETRALLQKWGWLHGVRTALSIIATALMLWGVHGV